VAISLRIFDTDPDAKPRQRKTFADDVVGRFRSGMMDGRRPVSLDEWRVTTGDADVAARVAELFGGTPEEWDTESEEVYQVLTTEAAVSIIVDGPDAVSSDLKLWSRENKLVHHCDGEKFLDDDRRGQPCNCPALLRERKEAARQGFGPKPDTRVVFRLADDPDLGLFRFQSGSWDLVMDLHEITGALEDVGGPAKCKLALIPVSYEIKKGPHKGRRVAYTRPEIRVFGPA